MRKVQALIRNGLKRDITNALVSDLSTQLGETATVGRTSDGVAVELEIGGEMLVFTIDPVIKPLDYDFETETADFAEIVAEREQKEQERLAKKKQEKNKKEKMGKPIFLILVGRRMVDDPNFSRRPIRKLEQE